MGAQKVGAFDREAFYRAVDGKRWREGLSGREVMRQAGVDTPSTWTRITNGAEVSLDTLLRLLAWLGESDVTPYSTLKHRPPDEGGGEAEHPNASDLDPADTGTRQEGAIDVD